MLENKTSKCLSNSSLSSLGQCVSVAFTKDYSRHQSMVLALKNRFSKYMKQNLTELKGEIHSPIAKVEDFNDPLSITDRTTWQKISK